MVECQRDLIPVKKHRNREKRQEEATKGWDEGSAEGTRHRVFVCLRLRVAIGFSEGFHGIWFNLDVLKRRDFGYEAVELNLLCKFIGATLELSLVLRYDFKSDTRGIAADTLSFGNGLYNDGGIEIIVDRINEHLRDMLVTLYGRKNIVDTGLQDVTIFARRRR